MNPLAWIIAEKVARTKMEMLTRSCPRCGHKQVVPEEKLTAAVRCERCAATVPPPPMFKR